MTLYALLLQACGLSHREAAELHSVRVDTIKSWSTGRNRAADGAVAELRALYEMIDEAALASLEQIDAGLPPIGGEIEISYPADDHEARALGFPCVGAWRAMAALVVAGLDRPVRMVPRGATAGSAAAADAAGR